MDQRVLTDYLQKELDARQMALRDLFVQEYMKDFDPYKAALRLGFQFEHAAEFAREMQTCAYTQRQITEFNRRLDATVQAAEDAALTNRLRQIAMTGRDSASVSAAKLLLEMKGLLKKDEPVDAAVELIAQLRDFARVAPV